MMYKVKILSTANQDILDIEEYLSQYYPSTPADFFAALDEKILLLRGMPEMGQTYKNFRRIICGDYLLFYKINKADKAIEIYRILHGSRDIDKYIPNT